ncbi:putative NTE family protein [Aquicella siphonis]|uniref:Putative NTE family protein n=1 Tax=Aquicella siphonis TaxID=254247 RepID=A0A5E4PLB0_9COXI|nr:patatin-like phospholipase family protein [Aquicella siphonis]VVC77052.1 putative NTE family protein [Aquicella siphonis]
MSADNLVTQLKQCHLFSSLPKHEFNSLSDFMQKIHLKENDFLYRQNEPSNFLYIIVKGKLTTLVKGIDSEYSSIDVIHPGEVIGELGVLSGEPRSLSVMALTDAEIISLPGEIFRSLCERYPSMLMTIMSPVLKRAHKAIQVIEGNFSCKYVLIFPIHTNVNLNEVITVLIKNLKNHKNIYFAVDTHESVEEMLNQNSHLEGKYELIVILFRKFMQFNNPLLKGKLNKVYFVTHESSDTGFDQENMRHLVDTEKIFNVKYELILLHNKILNIAENTKHWLTLANFSSHHHFHLGDNDDQLRFTRVISGKRIGLVLGGGGIRGWTHIGVLKALEEMKIPIDAIGGTSIGALVGACYAMTRNYQITHDLFQKLTNIISLMTFVKEITYPLISFFNGKHGTNILQEVFKEHYIEDLWIPYFCISANLSTREDVIHSTGLLWEKLRASNSLPGIVPPMVIDGQLHFDGGLVNNLPVDRMKNLLGANCKTIASLLTNFKPDETNYVFPPILGLTSSIFYKMGLNHGEYVIPPILDTFIQSVLMGSSLNEKHTLALADVVINMDFINNSILFLKNLKPDQLIQSGYEAACKKLSGFLR